MANEKQAGSALMGWQAFLDNAGAPGQMRPVILESWERCARAGLPRRPAEPIIRRVSPGELAGRLEASAALRAAAAPHLEWASACFSDVAHAVYITDADGIVLAAVGHWPEGLGAIGLEPGCDWSEATMGTNGAGTAVAAGQPVAVIGEEHYSIPFHRCTCTGAPLHAPNGRIIGAIDLSTFAEEAKPGQLMLVAHLAYMIDQTLRFQAQIKEADSIKPLAQLSSFTAHELVSPLATVANAVDMLRRMPMPEEAQRILAILDHSASRLSQTVQDLRLLGGSHASDTFQVVDVAALARDVLSEFQLPAVTVVLNVPPSSAVATCHPRLLARALGNLVRNACDAMSGGGTVGIDIDPAPDSLSVTVWDTGPGIPSDKRHSLFAESFTTKSHGSGLGLLLTKAIVERVHGGAIEYRANTPRGSRFELRLPRELNPTGC